MLLYISTLVNRFYLSSLYHLADACCVSAASISYNFMGTILSVFVGGAVLPVAFVLFWGGCTALGACVGTLTGGICGVVAWVVTAQKMYVSASVLSLQNNEPILAGCCCGVGIAAIVCIALVRYAVVAMPLCLLTPPFLHCSEPVFYGCCCMEHALQHGGCTAPTACIILCTVLTVCII